MEARGMTLVVLVLLISSMLLSLLSYADGEVEAPTLISGTVTDSETGLPVEGAFVAAVNSTRDLHFYYRTEADGSYSFNVGSPGGFTIAVYTESHEYRVREVEVDLFDQETVDFQLVKHDHNVRVHFYSWDDEYPLFALEVIITDSTGLETFYLTEPDGWLRLELEDGDYHIRTHRDHLETYERNFTISENEVLVETVNLRPVNVYGDASLIVFHDVIYIPPKEFRAVVIEDEEPTEMWLSVNSDVRITIQQMTQNMFDKYLEKHTGAPYPHEEPPILEYDSRLETKGGGGSVTVWKLPYYVVLANNETESALVSVDLRYEYGSPIVSGVLGGPLEPYVLEEGSGDLGLSSIYLILIFSVLSAAIVAIYRSHRK
ncbi:MAG: carboxypeptidase-like regulatory domain-containing protein [Thermoplasmatota archaeon]